MVILSSFLSDWASVLGLSVVVLFVVGGVVGVLLLGLVLMLLLEELLLVLFLLRLDLEDVVREVVVFCVNSFGPVSIPNQYVVGSSLTTPDLSVECSDNPGGGDRVEEVGSFVGCRGGGCAERGCGGESMVDAASLSELAMMCSSTARKS
jgi:hypothetical protein